MRSICHTLLLALVPSMLTAQSVSSLRSIGSLAEDRERLAQLTGASTAQALLRDGARVDSDTLGLRWLFPEVNFTWNRALATSLNDGALWSGRGSNVLVRGGATFGWRRVRLTIAPEITASQNAPVEVMASRVSGWSRWASPWRTSDVPADMPLRFGDASLVTIHGGQSALSAQWDKVSVGISSGNLWWGPGLRNALVLSNQAAGIPHAFIRTPRPLRSRFGDVEGRLIIGGLTESLYFDTLTSNDTRSVSGLALTFTPKRVPTLTVGLARLVVAPVGGAGEVAGHLADALTTWNGDDARDQLSSLFFRWIAPESGFEFWGEWAKSRLPVTFRELLTAPNADQAWTTGAQWALPRAKGTLRLQLEFSDLAQSQVFANRMPRDYYTGNAAIHGFTQRGQVLGAASGSGSTHGWLAADRIFDSWSAGGFLARTRWENDAFYRSRLPNSFGHDVSLFSGVRGSRRFTAWDAQGALMFERRVNYLFESGFTQPLQRGQRNASSWRLEFSVAPRPR
jgi:hypothetical protein